MAPNIIGSTFILAETAISDANNNNKSSLVGTKTSTQSTAAARVPTQGEPAALAKSNTNTTTATSAETATQQPYKVEVVHHNVILFILLHASAFYGIYLVFAENAYFEMAIGYFSAIVGGLGITAGVHRLWSHKSYKAKLPLRIALMLMQSMAFQNSIYEWTRDHRVHHKFTETNADPHNSKRGFFFAHMGWLMCKKHPDVKNRGKTVDLTDLENDPVVMFQKKYYFFIMPICCFVVPALFPYFVLGSSIRVCFFVCSMLRYTISLHGTWLVNSAAHFYGMKPYDRNISPVNSKFVSIVAFGEGWHNYHHVFPWDYKAAELGNFKYNWTVGFIHLMEKLGQAYDLKSVSREMILKRVLRTGDGTYDLPLDFNNNDAIKTEELIKHLDHEKETSLVWGWDDKDILLEDRKGADIRSKKDD